MEFSENLEATHIVPVIVIKELGHAVPLAKALVEGGLNILEVTLRAAAALEVSRPIPAGRSRALWATGSRGLKL
jgi:2-dehydro-3-deoxyphosphogluconate aldolase/(4S)-4-hydroxy-2-oxoglutarate aldolase